MTQNIRISIKINRALGQEYWASRIQDWSTEFPRALWQRSILEHVQLFIWHETDENHSTRVGAPRIRIWRSCGCQAHGRLLFVDLFEQLLGFRGDRVLGSTQHVFRKLWWSANCGGYGGAYKVSETIQTMYTCNGGSQALEVRVTNQDGSFLAIFLLHMLTCHDCILFHFFPYFKSQTLPYRI